MNNNYDIITYIYYNKTMEIRYIYIYIYIYIYFGLYNYVNR